MNGYNIFYMGMSGNFAMYLEYYTMFLGNWFNSLSTQYGYEGSKGVRLEKFVAITLMVFGHCMCNRMF